MGGMAGDCLIGAQEVPARGTLTKFFLNGPGGSHFDISSAGTYHIKATKTVTIDGNGGFGDVIAKVVAEDKFDILIREPADGELEGSYAGYVEELSSSDYETRAFAAQALTQDPPKFLEPVVLSLASSEDQGLRFPSINGLRHLATPAARAKLIEMASGSDESLAQQAIPALGEIANPDDCAAMLRIAGRATQYTKAESYRAAGRICGERAVPILVGLLPTADQQLAQAAATALGNTGSREAVPPLINLLASRDQWVRTEAERALFTLTHRAIQDVSTPAAAAQVSSDWRSWWLMNSDSSQIYGPDQCPATQQP